ncbi:methanogenesis marker 6 protein [Methanotorris igneus]|uniref:Methanogenesis marker protein 6 n=1 Tax=Methanotorris igneus (strain DSM 5666 / JCM 11834 / Kol 5) TaxID=880724 RepID=F6BAT8_METIK|nr:methanogenesis marker 6 protein [Methanotorris igneus]AEF95902.1 methanogenesis marker protein 6 [Methanotorris igneus Kol 5]
MKTKVIVLADNAETTPSKLFRFLNSLNYDINVKETCFGAYIEGEDDVVDKVANIVRNLEKNRIFCKDRGFPIWDKRRCRAFRGGGPREGFHQLEAEQKILDKIAKALDEIEKEGIHQIDEIEKEKVDDKTKKLDVETFKKIIDEEFKHNQ